MDTEKLDRFRNLLELQLDELSESGSRMVSGLTMQENFYADPMDRASADESQSFMLRIKDRESRLINKIQAALRRIRDGEFGYCDICEEEISAERLMARPVATHCIACKRKLEEMEKIRYTGD